MDNFIVIMMVKRAFISLNFFLLFLLASLQTTHATSPSLEAKGAAIYQELGIEYYIASLYVEDSSIGSHDVINYAGAQQVKIKVIAKRWSARKWRAQWQNNIAINNEPSSNQNLNSDLALFTEFPQASLVEGDEVSVIYQPGLGSELVFNGYSVFKTQDKQFYNYILNTWLGKFSPNRIFREKISGQQKLNLALVQNSHQELDENRKEKTLLWFMTENYGTDDAASISATTLAAANELKEKQEKAIKAKEAEKKRQRIEEQKKQAQLLKLKQDKEKAEKIKLAQQQAKQKEESAKKWLAEQEKKRLALKIEEEKKLKILNQQKYYHQLYQWQIRSRVNETVAYPPWAKQFNQQGVVSITFNVNRSGVVSDLKHSDEGISPILQQEVEKRLQLAAEAIAVPKDLKGDTWSFNVRYVFDLKLPEQAALLKPLKPL